MLHDWDKNLGDISLSKTFFLKYILFLKINIILSISLFTCIPSPGRIISGHVGCSEITVRPVRDRARVASVTSESPRIWNMV